MNSLSIRDIIEPFLCKFSEAESLSPYFALALYHALFRNRLPTGLSKRVAQSAFDRCVRLETLFRNCELPSPERWAKDPLHPRVLRLAASLTTEERRELGSLLLCYLHAQPLAAISLWWQEKADFEVSTILDKYLGEQYSSEQNANRGHNFIDRIIAHDAAQSATQSSAEQNPLLLNAVPTAPAEKVLRLQKKRFGKSEWMEVKA